MGTFTCPNGCNSSVCEDLFLLPLPQGPETFVGFVSTSAALLFLWLLLFLSPIFLWLTSIQAVTPLFPHLHADTDNHFLTRASRPVSSHTLGNTIIYVMFQENVLFVVHCISGVGLLLMGKRWEVWDGKGGKMLGGWSGKLLVQGLQIKCLSMSSCTVWAKLISLFLARSFHPQLPPRYLDFFNTLKHPLWCLSFQRALLSAWIYLFSPISFLLSMSAVCVVQKHSAAQVKSAHKGPTVICLWSSVSTGGLQSMH